MQVRGAYDEIRRMGAEVLVVSFEPVELLPGYRTLHGWPFPVVSDPERAAYSAFGLGSAGWTELLGPRVLLRYARLILRGYRIRGTAGDVHQLGGDFVLGPERRLVYVHRSADPADRPPVSALLNALAALGHDEAGGTS